ncbi:MAG TPA: S41 family peptidase [Solirubrobacterales bacterium]|nr:S41 family peptidase [Solirubrobacterales bacterium]
MIGVIAGVAIAVLLGAIGLLERGPADPVEQARSLIEQNYFEEVSGEALDEASIEGMVRGLRRDHGDRFSHYFTPDQLRDFEAATSGRFSGVGMTVLEVDRGLRVASVIPDAPAEQAGIGEGDVILAVDGEEIAGVPADVAAARIKGPAGTEVELEVASRGDDGSRDVTLERESVRLPAADGEVRRAGGTPVAYVRFLTFSKGAHGELRETIEELYRDGAEGLVIDLRGNGGGLLNEAVLSASAFVDEGPIVTTRSRTRGERTYEATGDPLDPRPTVVLTNRDTASAAEILTAALSDYDLATVVGRRTFGKGSFQEVIELEGGGALDLTIGEYVTAEGVSLAGDGVHPDVRAEDEPETERDEALREALRVLAEEL